MFKITKDDKIINLSEERLVELLFKKSLVHLSKDPENLDAPREALINLVNKKLQHDLLSMTAEQTYTIYFLIGYYYNSFLSKNNVKYRKKDNV